MYKVYLIFIFSLFVAACGGSSGGGGNDNSFDRQALLTNVADNIIIPTYNDFTSKLGELDTSVDNYCNEIASNPGGPDETADRNIARDDWREAMDVWQQAELFLLSPASDNNNALRNRILNFSEGNFFDETATESSSASVTDLVGYQALGANQKGLLAIEYILYNSAADQGDVARGNRCRYAQFIVEDMSAAITVINDGWASTIRPLFINPSIGFNALTDALFYLDIEVKDLRLGLPLDVNDACTTGFSCPEDIESPYSETTMESVKQNLVSFKNIFTGSTGLGFDDFYANENMQQTSTDFIADIDAAIAAIDALSTPLDDDVAAITDANSMTACVNAIASPESTSSLPSCNIYGFVKRVTDKLSTEFTAIVGVDIPSRAQGDND